MSGLRLGLVVCSLLGAGLFVVLARGFGHDPHAVPSVLQHTPASPFVLRSLEGTTVDLAQWRGRPVVLNFWATWCLPCQAEHQVLQQGAHAYGDQVHFAGVIYQDAATAVQRYLADHPLPFVQLLDPGSQVAIDYGVAGVPETYIIDPDGRIAHKHAGVLSHALLAQYLQAWVPAAAARVP